MSDLEGERSAQGRKIAVIAARFNAFIVDGLLDGARKAWAKAGGDAGALTVIRCPGAFELPLVAQRVAERGAHHAIVCLGCVIRGATPHFDYVAGEAARGITDVALQTKVPIVFGVLTTDTIEQAIERLGKGGEAIETALEMASLLEKIGKGT